MTYFVKKRFLKWLLSCLDILVPNRKQPKISPPKKILVCNTAHIGDFINSSYVIGALKKAYPNAKIGVLIHPIAKDLAKADYIHTIEHYKHNRCHKNLMKKWLNYIKQLKLVIKSLKDNNYDIAIDLYPYFGNSSVIIALSKIPLRIGFTNGGLSNLYHYKFTITDLSQQIVYQYIPILKLLDVNPKCLSPQLNQKPVELPKKPYVVIHPGSAKEAAFPSTIRWIEIIHTYNKQKKLLVFVGKGKNEKTIISNLQKYASCSANLVDQLSLSELAYLINHADHVVGLDSMATHLAGAMKKPFTQLLNNTQETQLWEVFS